MGEIEKVQDPNRIWMPCYQLTQKNPARYLPPVLALRANRGFMIYHSQPKLCRKYGEEGHLALVYPYTTFSICSTKGHMAKDCKKKSCCSLCQEEGMCFTPTPSHLGKSKAAKKGEQRAREKRMRDTCRRHSRA